MGLDRGVLARIDRKLLAGHGQDETYRMVRVPVTAAKWATWKRYCESAGISMGRAIVILIDRELVSAFGGHSGDYPPVLTEQADEGRSSHSTAAITRHAKRANVAAGSSRGDSGSGRFSGSSSRMEAGLTGRVTRKTFLSDSAHILEAPGSEKAPRAEIRRVTDDLVSCDVANLSARSHRRLMACASGGDSFGPTRARPRSPCRRRAAH